MANRSHIRLVSVNTRDGVDTRKQENSVMPREAIRGDSLSVDAITGLGRPAVLNWDNEALRPWGDLALELDGTAPPQTPSIEHVEITDLERAFRVYRDMADEPAKYGDDIHEWLELDESLRASRKNWSVERYWSDREEAIENKIKEEQKTWRSVFTPVARETALVAGKRRIAKDIRKTRAMFNNAAIRIQALVRGYQVRCANPCLDCCMCLAHCFAPLKTDVGFMCRECAKQGPYAEIVEDDPWNWFRSDYIDVTSQCDEERCICGAPAELPTRFCSHECYVEFMDDTYRRC